MKLKVEIENPDGKSEVVDLTKPAAPHQESLLDRVEDQSKLVAFGCRAGSCGTCMVEVLSGGENLEPITPQEEDTLSRIRTGPNCRLACRARVKDDATGTLAVKTFF